MLFIAPRPPILSSPIILAITPDRLQHSSLTHPLPSFVALSCPSFLSLVQTCPCLASWPYPFKSGLGWAAVSRRLLHTLLGSTDGRDRLPAGTGTPTILTGDWPTGPALCSTLCPFTLAIVLPTSCSYISPSLCSLSLSISSSVCFISRDGGSNEIINKQVKVAIPPRKWNQVKGGSSIPAFRYQTYFPFRRAWIFFLRFCSTFLLVWANSSQQKLQYHQTDG